jgi:Protein of unknown function (DUF2844)
MKMRIVAALAVVVLGVAPAWAVLGESVRSVQSDQQRLRGQLLAVARQGYSLHQITAADGNIVREYVSQEGTVFGVSWQGRTMPDLRHLLGSYYSELLQNAQSPHRRRGPLVVRTDHAVLQSGGHVRAFRGRAYVPSLIPNTLTQAVVQ